MSPTLKCHTLTSKNISTEQLDKLFNLYNSVFNEGRVHEDYPSDKLSIWKEHIEEPHCAIFYVADSSTDDRQPLGFFFAFPMTQPEIGKPLLHLWLAAVDPASRGLGVFPILVEKMRAWARECGFEEMTVCTFPDRFTTMWRILQKNGWEVVAWPEVQPGPGKSRKVLMKMRV